MNKPLRTALATAATIVAICAAAPATARADDGPPVPTEAETAACVQAWTPNQDPRVNMRYGLGAAIYIGLIQAKCSAPDAVFPNGALVAGSGVGPVMAPWQQLPAPSSAR